MTTIAMPPTVRTAPFDQVVRLLNAYDPEGLLALGAPADEYEREAGVLADQLRAGHPVTATTLTALWDDWFGPQSWFTSHHPDRVAALAVQLTALTTTAH